MLIIKIELIINWNGKKNNSSVHEFEYILYSQSSVYDIIKITLNVCWTDAM